MILIFLIFNLDIYNIINNNIKINFYFPMHVYVMNTIQNKLGKLN